MSRRSRWARAAVLGGAILAAAALCGCRQGYLPYYDEAPEPERVAYDENHAARIVTRRVLLDRIAANSQDLPAVRLLAAEEWNSGRQAEALRVLDYLLAQLNANAPAASGSAPVRETLLQKVQYMAQMPYSAERIAAARKILEGFAPADRDAAYGYAGGLVADRAAAYAPTPADREAETARAIECLDAALANDPRHAAALQLRARLAFEAGDWNRVVDLCSRWREVLPEDGRARYTQGVALQRLKRYEEAIGLFAEAVRLEPEQPDPWYGLAIAHMAAGDQATADHALREVLRLKPTHAQAYFKLFLLYSAQPVDDGRFALLVKAATLARRDPTIQQALIDTTRRWRPDRGDLLLFGLKNLMNLELEHGRRLNLAPILAFVDEAERQRQYEEAFFALADPLRLGPRFEASHPEIGLRLLKLANRWVDPETGHWNPPEVSLLDPTKPLAAENIGRPVQFKAILDAALAVGRYMYEAQEWDDFERLVLDGDLPRERQPGDPAVLAEKLSPAEREELVLLLARVNVARNEHLRRVIQWHQALSPIVPYNLKFVGSAPVPLFPTWWLQGGFDAFREVRVSDILALDDPTGGRAVAALTAAGPILIEELRAGLSRDNYGEPAGSGELGIRDLELFMTLRDGQFALDLLSKLDDAGRRGADAESQRRRREWAYLSLELAPLLPVGGRGDTRLQRLVQNVQSASAALPELLQSEDSERRRSEMRIAGWYWQMRQGDQGGLARELGDGRGVDAQLPYACAARLWLRAMYLNRAGWGEAPAKVAAPEIENKAAAASATNVPVATSLRADLEGMLAGLSQYDSVPAMRMRMQLSTAVGLAFGDDTLAAAAAENLVRVEAGTENGQETQVLVLLAMIYEKQGRTLPAVYCLRRAIARMAASRSANDAEKRGFKPVGMDDQESIRLLRWRLHNLWVQQNKPELAAEQLAAIAGFGPDGQPINASGSADRSESRAAALYALAARRMAEGRLGDCYALCYEAYTSYESVSDKIEQYRLTYCLIALAADPVHNRDRVRDNIQRDLLGGRQFRADNARVLEAFDAALQGKPNVILETPSLASKYLRPAQEALELALAIRAARAGDASMTQDHLSKAAAGHCAGVAGMARAVGMLCDAWLAKKQGSGDYAAKRQAWLDQGGLAEYLEEPATAVPGGAAAP